MLNDLKVKQLKAKDKIYRVADHSGLCIEVRIAGTKFWRYRYRYLNKAKMLTIGQYPEISLSYARSKTMEYREQLAKGIDPITSQKNERSEAIQSSENTFRVIALEFCEKKKDSKSEEWLYVRKRSFDTDIFPFIGDKPIKDVTASDIRKILDNTIVRVKKIGRGTGEVSASRVRQHLGEIMQYAILSDRLEIDPTYILRGYIDNQDVDHAQPVPYAERHKIFPSIDKYKGSVSTKNALKALIYSMLRSVEIRRGLKSYIDFEQKTWTIPIASRAEIKAGKRNMKKNRMHIVPLSEQLIDIIKTQFAAYPNSEYIFPGHDGVSIMGATTFNQAFRNMELHPITMHDFRATASTDLNELNFNSDWIELQLAHVKADKTRASYDHAKWLDGRREMLQKWADIVDSWKN